MTDALRYWLLAKWRQWTRYDLKGDLQMQERAARRDLIDAWRTRGGTKGGRDA